MKYKHALFLNPFVPNQGRITALKGLFPLTGLEYIATSAKGLVDKVTLLDMRYEKDLSDTGKLLDFIQSQIDVICVGTGWDREFKEIAQFLNLMPENIPLIVGGYKVTEMIEKLFESCPKIDIVVRGEGEETIRDIFKDVPLENILGISYRKDGRVIHNANRPLTDVNAVSIPDRSLRRNDYHLRLNGINLTNTTYDYILTARGCAYNCKFCTFNLNPLGQKRNYSPRKVESVIEELEATTADTVMISDDNFFVDVKRTEKIFDLIIERGIKKRFIAQARIEIAKYPALLEKAAKAGIMVLLLGLESPHDRILAQLNKGFTSDTMRKYLKVLKKYPIYCHGFFIYGNIGESEEEMMCIPKFAKEIGVDSIGCSKLRIDKYSPLKELAEKTPGYHVTDKGELYSDMYSHPALKKIGKRMKFAYYTPLRLLKILRKLITVKFFTFRELLSLIAVSPLLLKDVIARELQKGRLDDSLKRIFISNR